MAGVDGVEAEKLAESAVEKTEGVGDETAELVWEMAGDRTIGDTGCMGAKWVAPPDWRRLPLPESGDGRFGAVGTLDARAGKERRLLVLECLSDESAGDVCLVGAKWVGPVGCASSRRDNGDGFLSAVAAREILEGSVLRLLNRGEGLLTMSALNWNGSGGGAGSDGRVARDGRLLLLLNSGLGTSSPAGAGAGALNWNMGWPTISISGFEGVAGSDFRYW